MSSYAHLCHPLTPPYVLACTFVAFPVKLASPTIRTWGHYGLLSAFLPHRLRWCGQVFHLLFHETWL